MASPAWAARSASRLDLGRFGAFGREDQQEDLAAADRLDPGRSALPADLGVAMGDPAEMAGALDRVADRLGDGPILGAMADENVVGQKRTSCALLRAIV